MYKVFGGVISSSQILFRQDEGVRESAERTCAGGSADLEYGSSSGAAQPTTFIQPGRATTQPPGLPSQVLNLRMLLLTARPEWRLKLLGRWQRRPACRLPLRLLLLGPCATAVPSACPSHCCQQSR